MNVIPDGKDFMEVLEEITAKDMKDVDAEETAFMKARSYYLTPGQLKKFADVLEEPTPSEPEPRTAKKTKAKLD